jgi:hypothetical protein
MKYSDYKKVLEAEIILEYHKWGNELPYLKLKEGWQIKVTPPVSGAIIRFIIKYKDKAVSVYFDAHEKLGSFGEPYWEMYPTCGDYDIFRFALKDHDELIDTIDKYFKDELSKCS